MVIVRAETAFFAHSHKVEKIARPSLFHLSGISHEEKLENLLLVLSDDDWYATKSMASLPTNEGMLRELNKGQKTHTNSCKSSQKAQC